MKESIYLLIVVFIVGGATGSFAQVPDVAASSEQLRTTAKTWGQSVRELKESVTQLLEESRRLNDERDALAREILAIENDIAQLRQVKQQLIDEPARVAELIKERTTEEALLQKEIAVLEKEMAALKSRRQPFDKQMEDARRRAEPLRSERDELLKREAALHQELQRHSAARGQAAAQVQQQLRALEDQIAASEKQQEALRARIDADLKQYTDMLNGIKQLRVDNRQLARDVSRALGEKNSLAKELERVERRAPSGISDQLARATETRNELIQSRDRVQAQINDIREKEQALAPLVDHEDIKEPLLGQIREAQGENQLLRTKIADLNEAIELVKRDNAMVEALLDIQREKRHGAVQQRVEGATAAAPLTDASLEAMGYAFASQGMFDTAIEYYKKALREGGNKKNIYFNLGSVYYQMGDLKNALGYYRRVLRIDSSDAEAQRNVELLREEISRPKRRQ